MNLNRATILFDYVLHSASRFHRFQREQGTLYKRFHRLPVRDQVGSLFICLNTSRGDARPLVFKLRATWSFPPSLTSSLPCFISLTLMYIGAAWKFRPNSPVKSFPAWRLCRATVSVCECVYRRSRFARIVVVRWFYPGSGWKRGGRVNGIRFELLKF